MIITCPKCQGVIAADWYEELGAPKKLNMDELARHHGIVGQEDSVRVTCHNMITVKWAMVDGKRTPIEERECGNSIIFPRKNWRLLPNVQDEARSLVSRMKDMVATLADNVTEKIMELVVRKETFQAKVANLEKRIKDLEDKYGANAGSGSKVSEAG